MGRHLDDFEDKLSTAALLRSHDGETFLRRRQHEVLETILKNEKYWETISVRPATAKHTKPKSIFTGELVRRFFHFLGRFADIERVLKLTSHVSTT